MKSRIRTFAMHLTMAGMLALAAPLAAVEISPSGDGGALVFPIWVTTNGHSSVLSVADSQPQHGHAFLRPQAVKMLIRGDRGQLLLSANIYLRRAEDPWTASITPLANGQSRLASSDDSCVLVGEPGAVVPWSGSLDLNADHGFIEFIVMASFNNVWENGSCEALASRWNGGVWSQDPGTHAVEQNQYATLRGTLNLVNVQKGTSYTIPATALREFSDIAQHTAPSSMLPDLASAHDSGTASNATHSRVCDKRGCIEGTWDLPRDAVAAALMASELRGDYSDSPILAGQTDLVFSYPLRHHFAAAEIGWQQRPFVLLDTFDRSGAQLGGEYGVCPPTGPPGGCQRLAAWLLDLRGSVSAVSLQWGLSGGSSTLPSKVLGISQTPLGSSSDPPPPEGSIVAGQSLLDSGSSGLVSNEGHVYRGLPVIGVVFQQFENGNLLGDDGVQQRANYGVAVPMTRRMVWP